MAFIAKELPHNESRNANVWPLLDGINLQNKIALDMGCGFGRDTAEIRRRGATCWGIDISPPLLNEARQRFGGTDWCEADLLTLKTPPAQPVDLIWCCAFLVHVPHDTVEALLHRWAQWLKKGGRIAIVTKAGIGQKVFNNLGENLPRDMVYHQLPQIQSILENCGGKIEIADETATTASGEPLLYIRSVH